MTRGVPSPNHFRVTDYYNTMNEDECLEMVKWLKGNGCMWDHATLSEVVNTGHVQVLEWMKENGCPCVLQEGDCATAAYKGYLTVLKWLRKNGCCWDAFTFAVAAR